MIIIECLSLCFSRSKRVKLFADIYKEAVVAISYVGAVLIEVLYSADEHFSPFSKPLIKQNDT